MLLPDGVVNRNHRRQFLKLGGMAVLGTGLLMACSPEEEVILTENEKPTPAPGPQDRADSVFDLGEGDAGLLNYLYALAQLGADFYTQAVNSTADLTEIYRMNLQDMYNHEVNQRELLRTVVLAEVGGEEELVLPPLHFQEYSLTTPQSIDYYANVYTNTSIAAYNGVGRYFSNPEYILLASKIGSVHARHAAANNWYGFNGFFVGGPLLVSNLTGLERAWDPSQVLDYHYFNFQ